MALIRGGLTNIFGFDNLGILRQRDSDERVQIFSLQRSLAERPRRKAPKKRCSDTRSYSDERVRIAEARRAEARYSDTMKNNENKNENQENKFVNPWRKSLPPLSQKPRFRNLKRAILILLAFFVLAIAVPRLYSEISFRWQYRDLIAQNKAFQRDYVKYSGKTPQEVYEKYVSALKRGDIEEASKYYSTPKAVSKKKTYWEKLKAEGKYEKKVNDLPKWEELKEEEYSLPDIKRLITTIVHNEEQREYNEILKKEIIWPPGEYVNYTFDFYSDSKLKLWKLYD